MSKTSVDARDETVRDETVRDETIERWAGSHDLPRSTGIQASRFREPVTVACQLSEELKALPTKTTSPSITRTGGPCLASQHSATNASSYNPTTK